MERVQAKCKTCVPMNTRSLIAKSQDARPNTEQEAVFPVGTDAGEAVSALPLRSVYIGVRLGAQLLRQ